MLPLRTARMRVPVGELSRDPVSFIRHPLSSVVRYAKAYQSSDRSHAQIRIAGSLSSLSAQRLRYCWTGSDEKACPAPLGKRHVTGGMCEASISVESQARNPTWWVKYNSAQDTGGKKISCGLGRGAFTNILEGPRLLSANRRTATRIDGLRLFHSFKAVLRIKKLA